MPEWPDREARSRYIRFLELELRMMLAASHDGLDPALMQELDLLLKEYFPRTTMFIENRMSSERVERREKQFEEVGMFAWVEAHSVKDESGEPVVRGTWTKEEIDHDIRDCFREAQARVLGGTG